MARSPRVLMARGPRVLLLALLAACGAVTELDDFSEGLPADAGRIDASSERPEPGTLLAGFSGDIADDGTMWERPIGCEPSGRLIGPYSYSIARFVNPLAVDIVVTIQVDWSFDGYLHVYRELDPRGVCLASNDDWEGDTRQSRVFGVTVPAFTGIDLVLSSFSDGRSGRYDAFVIAE